MPEKENKIRKFGKKIVKFFLELKSELKKVIWPDRKKLLQSTITVMTICLLVAAVVYLIDKVLSSTLDAVGFFPETSSTAASNVLSTPASSAAVSSLVSSMEESAASTASGSTVSSESASASSSAASSSQG